MLRASNASLSVRRNSSGNLLARESDTRRKDHTTRWCVDPRMRLFSKNFARDFQAMASP
jgi:hypothetical protein